MAELGGMLASAILKVVGDQIGSAIECQIKLQQDFSDDLEKMKMALESVRALLGDAERRSITEEPTRLWLNRLKDAMYVIADMLDEFESDTQAITRPSPRKFYLKRYLAIVIPCLTIGPRIKLANKMEQMRRNLEMITDQHKKFKFSSSDYTNELKNIEIRETSSIMETQLIIGRTEEREKILWSLSESMGKEMTIIPIYGIGGLGKTTLAKMVYNSSQFKDYSQVWVYVSQTFDLKKIGNSIISQLSENESHQISMQTIKNSLSKLLAGKNILIVLDDLWEDKESHLDSLKAMLKVGKGSKVVVVVTTRVEGIAQKISTIQPHKLEPLTHDMCWSIIKQKSAFESRGDKEHLEDIGMDIAKKCGGVALAAQSLGHMLHSMTSDEWESVRNNDVWNICTSEYTASTHVLPSLRLSYSAMPPYLKLCFAYCAIFPKGYKILKDDLIHQWVSLGFIKPTNVFSFWQLGERYIRQLVGLSFLQNSKSPSTVQVYDEDFTLLTMHDLVHDLARSVMIDDILVAGKNGNTGGSCYDYALLNDSSKPLESSKIRALRFMDCGEIKLDGAAFLSAKSLRVLDLSECSIYKLPNSIGVLKQLRYLNAPGIQDTIIPDSITKLSKLTYLNLHGSSAISALPESIGDIEGLLYIDLSGCSGIEILPESFRRLTKLVHLDLSNCSRVGGISVFLGSLAELQYLNLSYCPNIGELPKELGVLLKLRYLNLSFSSYLQRCQEAEVLSTLTKLKYLNLSSDCCHLQRLPEALGGFVQLKYLYLSGCQHMEQLPKLFGNLKNLVHLDLSNCSEVEYVPKALGGLTSLQYLNLSRPQCRSFPKLADLREVIGNLRELRYLNLSGCIDSMSYEYYLGTVGGQSIDAFTNNISALSNLEHLVLSNNESLCSIPASFCNLRKLHTLDLSNCRSLMNIPESIGTIDSLKFLYADSISEPPRLNRNAISLPHFVVYSSDGESSSNLVRLQHTDPVVLHIARLENVKTVEEAHSIKLIENHSMNKLELEWTRDAERFADDQMLLEKLVPPSTINKLVIRGYRSGSFPSWLMDITHYLPHLITLEMCDMPKCNSLPPMEQLPNLKFLRLRGLESLEEWNMSYSSGQECVIECVEISDCPKLRFKPLPPRTERLEISKSDNVLSSWGEDTYAFTTSSYPVDTALHVKHCEVPMHQWRLLQHLPGLTSLEITACGDLTGSPDIIQHLSSLKSVKIQNRDQEELPKWLGELTSLQKLEISECRLLKELHESMRLLTELQSLQLYDCNCILSLPHWLGELTSLNKVAISQLGIRSLPGSIQQLTNLQELSIRKCSELKHVAESEGNMNLIQGVCVLPTSLKKLEIHECHGIKSLPQGLQQLTNLEELDIRGCFALELVAEAGEGNMGLNQGVCLLPTSLKELSIHRCYLIRSLPEGLQQLTNLQKIDF